MQSCVIDLTSVIAFDEGERILILPWAQAECQIDLRDFRPGDRLAASTSCATVSRHGNKVVLRILIKRGFHCSRVIKMLRCVVQGFNQLNILK